MNGTNFRRLFWAIVTGYLLYAILKHFGVSGGFTGTAVLGITLLSFFADRLGRLGWVLRLSLLGVLLSSFILSWTFTKPTATKLKHDIQTASPRETFNPEDETPKGDPTQAATTKFMRYPDGHLEKVPVEWNRNRFTGLPLTNPGTPTFWEELNEYYAQEAKKQLEAEQKKAEPASFNTGERWEQKEGGFLTDESRSGVITLTLDAPSVVKDVTANLADGKSEARYSSYPLEGCAEVYCDGGYFGTQCAPKQLPSLPRKCNEIEYRLANGEKAVIGFNISVR